MLSSTNLLSRSRALLQHSYKARYVSGYAGKPKHAKAEKPAASPESMEQFMQMVDSQMLGFDPWGQPMPILDLHVPTPWSALPKDATLRSRLKFMRLGAENKISNMVAMFRTARSRSFPWNPTASAYSSQIFRASSTKPKTWLEPLREIALDSYEQINTAVAANDINSIRTLTAGAYQKQVIARTKNLHQMVPSRSPASSKKTTPRATHVWRLHSLASPVRCVSIRGIQAHFGKTEPSLGTRWVVQACMRFDTWQSLAVFSPSSSLPPDPKRVLEYLVFEKRMWYDEPWLARDQLWEGVMGQYAPPPS